MTNPVPSAAQPAHSLIGASSFSRLIHCPGSFGLSQQVRAPGGGTSIYAATGTVAHALAEEAITQGYDPASQIDEVVTVDGYDVKVSAEMVEATRVYVAEVQARARGASFFALETRVVLDKYWAPGEHPGVSAFGTADTIVYHGATQHMDVIDYKNGAGVFVDVIDNPQLNYYAAGALLEVPGPVTTIDFTIVQPNVRGVEKVRTYKTSAVDVLMWVHTVLKPTIAEAMQPGARIAAGSHCRFCPARAACPALAKVAQDLARRDFGPSPDKPVVWTPDELGKILADAELVEVRTQALRQVALDNIHAGTSVPGWAAVPSRPLRTWGPTTGRDLQDAIHAILAEGETPPDVFAPSVLRTPAQMEKLLKPEHWAAIQPFVQSKSSGYRLVPDAADPGADDPLSGEKSARATAQDDFA